MTGIEIAGQKIAEELKKLKEMDTDTDATQERKAARKIAWNLQEKKRKAIQAGQQEVTKKAMNRIKAKLAEQKDKSIEQMIAEGAFNEDQRFKKMSINCSAW